RGGAQLALGRRPPPHPAPRRCLGKTPPDPFCQESKPPIHHALVPREPEGVGSVIVRARPGLQPPPCFDFRELFPIERHVLLRLSALCALSAVCSLTFLPGGRQLQHLVTVRPWGELHTLRWRTPVTPN